MDVVCEVDAPLFDARESPDEFDPERLERPIVEIAPASMARELRVREEPSARTGQLGEASLVEVGVENPAQDVTTLDSARHPRSAAAREVYVSSGLETLFSELAAGLSAANDQQIPFWQRARVGITLRIDRQDRIHGDLTCRGRPECALISPRSQHHLTGSDLGVRRPKRERAVFAWFDSGHLHAGSDGCAEAPSVTM